MAFAITSPKETVTVTEFGSYFEIEYDKRNFQHNRIILYIDYTKDTETGIDITIARMDNRVEKWAFEPIDDGSGALSLRTLNMSESNVFAIPMQVARNENFIKIIVTPSLMTGSGTCEVDIFENVLRAN